MIVEYVLTTETVVTDMAAFRRMYPHARIVSVDGRVYHGECEVCGALIVAGERHMVWADGKLSCPDCRR